MAKGKSTTSKQRALAVAEPTTPAEASTPQHVLLAPTVVDRLGALVIHGINAKDIAGLLRMCGQSIYKELLSIEKRHPDALVQHSQAVTEHIDYQADLIEQMGEAIENEAGEAVEVVRMMGGAA